MKKRTAIETERARQAFADRLSDAIDNSKYMQREIADILSTPEKKYTPTFINLVKQGRSKLPMYMVPKLARIIDVNPKQLMLEALEAYDPETAEIIREEMLLEHTPVEEGVLELFRKEVKDKKFELTGPNKKMLTETFKRLMVGR